MEELIMVTLAVAALLVRVGLGLYSSGWARSKNAAGAMARQICDFALATLALWAVGEAIWLQTGNGVLGLDPSLLFGNAAAGGPWFVLDLVLVLIATGAFMGAVGERSRLAVVGVMSVIFGAFLVPVMAHWTWTGWLFRRGFVDLGGAGFVHLAAGTAAAVASALVGPRSGKFNRDGSANGIPGHNIPLMTAGTLLMLAGWIPYLLACAVAHRVPWQAVAARTLVSAAAATLAAMWYSRTRFGKIDIGLTCAGLLGGLVAISAGAAGMPSGWALLTGAVAGLLVPIAAVATDLRFRLDDPTAAVAIHGVAGAWALLAAGLFSSPFTASLLLVQLLGLLTILITTGLITAAVVSALKLVIPVRSREADEYDGLDLAEHDVNAYPDFQQTMIKSYHMREA